MIALLGLLILGAPESHGTENTKRRVDNALLGYTHILPSPFTVPGGKLILGTDITFGVTDFMQVGTNVIFDFYKIFNANAKLKVFDNSFWAGALTMSAQTYNLRDISTANSDIQITTYQPGAVIGAELIPWVALFGGINLSFSQQDIPNGTESSGYTRGASLGSDIAWAYNPKNDRVGNVLAGGMTYDFLYKIFGFGVSHYWSGFHVGIHYYPNATFYKVLPILSGSASMDF